MSRDLQGAEMDHQVALARVGGDSQLLERNRRPVSRRLSESAGGAAGGRSQRRRQRRGTHRSRPERVGCNFGARSAVDAALRIETMGRNRQLADVLQVLQTIEGALAALRPELEAL